jgi:hypothetical protein
MKKIFAILAASIMVLLTFGVFTASADDCITVSGIVTGTYSTVNPCEEVTEPLVGVTITITDNHDFGTKQTVPTLAESGFIFKKPAGRYSASVYKGLSYTMTISYDAIIDGVPYKFEGSKTFTAGQEDTTINFNLDGVIQISKGYTRLMILQSFMHRFMERFHAIFN